MDEHVSLIVKLKSTHSRERYAWIKDFFCEISNIDVNLQNPVYIIALLGIAVIGKLIGKSVCSTGPQLILNSSTVAMEFVIIYYKIRLKHRAATIYYTLLYKIKFCLLFVI